MTLQSPVALLPSGDAPAPAPAPTPRRALALDALQFLRRLRGTATADAAWSDPAFGRQVESVRRQLAPIHSRRALAASFGAEAFHVRRPVLTPDGRPAGPMGPVRLAYAIRWLELGDGERCRPGTRAHTPRAADTGVTRCHGAGFRGDPGRDGRVAGVGLVVPAGHQPGRGARPAYVALWYIRSMASAASSAASMAFSISR